jgi:hypothetical protein
MWTINVDLDVIGLTRVGARLGMKSIGLRLY